MSARLYSKIRYLVASWMMVQALLLVLRFVFEIWLDQSRMNDRLFFQIAFILFFFAALFLLVPSLLAGYGVLKDRKWGWFLAMLLSLLTLLGTPKVAALWDQLSLTNRTWFFLTFPLDLLVISVSLYRLLLMKEQTVDSSNLKSST